MPIRVTWLDRNERLPAWRTGLIVASCAPSRPVRSKSRMAGLIRKARRSGIKAPVSVSLWVRGPVQTGSVRDAVTAGFVADRAAMAGRGVGGAKGARLKPDVPEGLQEVDCIAG